MGGVLKRGDRVDVYALSPSLSSTRLILHDALVYAVARDNEGESLTLAMPADQALAAQQAIESGARPFVVLRSTQLEGRPAPTAFSESDLGDWLRQVQAGGRS
jgi:hypothetical protein